MRKKYIVIGSVCLVVLVVGIVVIRSKMMVPPLKYEKISVTRQTIDLKVQATGNVQAQNRLAIKPPVSGRVEEILVNEGERLKKGKIIAWMSSTERVALIDAARGRGEEELEKWNELYKPTPIIAPMNGVLILRGVEPGHTVTTQDSVFVMSDRLIVITDVDETDIGRVKLSQKAIITLDAYPDQKMFGRVIHIAFDAKVTNNVTVYEVKVMTEKVPPFMKSGMTASVVFLVDRKEDALALPAEAVSRDDDKRYVLVGDSNGKVPPESREVEVGLTNGKLIEIVSGLKENDEVLIQVKRAAAQVARPTNPFMPMGRGRPGGGGGRPH